MKFEIILDVMDDEYLTLSGVYHHQEHVEKFGQYLRDNKLELQVIS